MQEVDLEEAFKKLNDMGEREDVLIELNQTIREECKNSYSTFIERVLIESEDLNKILKLLNNADKKQGYKKDILEIIYNVFHFLITQNQLEVMEWKGLHYNTLAKTIIMEYSDKLMQLLNLGSFEMHRWIFKIITMINLNCSHLIKEVLLCLNLKNKFRPILKALSLPQITIANVPNDIELEEFRKQVRQETRFIYLEMCISFLENLNQVNPNLILSHMLLERLIKGLNFDSPQFILKFFTMINNYIINNSSVGKQQIVALINEDFLSKCLELLTNEQSIEEIENASISSLTFEFLKSISTLPGHGICFKNKGWYPISNNEVNQYQVNNKQLLEFCFTLSPNDNLKHQKLLILIFNSSPELIYHYWKVSTLALEPRLSTRWLSNVSFMIKLIELKVPEFNIEVEDNLIPKASTIVENILPEIFNRNHQSKGLQHSSPLVRYYTCLGLVAVFNKFKLVIEKLKQHIEYLNVIGKDISLWNELYNSVYLSVKKRIVEFQVILKLKQSFNTNTEPSKLILQLVSNLILNFQQYFPDLIIQANFDMSKLFPEKFDEAQPSMLAQTLNLLLNLSELKWWSNEPLNKRSYIIKLLKMTFDSKVNTISQLSRKVIFKFLNDSKLFAHDANELDVWFEAFKISFKENDDADFMYTFLDLSLSTFMRSPYAFIDDITNLCNQFQLTDNLNNEEMIMPFSPWLLTIKQLFLLKVKENSLDKAHLLSLSQLIIQLCLNLFFYSENPVTVQYVLNEISKELEQLKIDKYILDKFQSNLDYMQYYLSSDNTNNIQIDDNQPLNINNIEELKGYLDTCSVDNFKFNINKVLQLCLYSAKYNHIEGLVIDYIINNSIDIKHIINLEMLDKFKEYSNRFIQFLNKLPISCVLMMLNIDTFQHQIISSWVYHQLINNINQPTLLLRYLIMKLSHIYYHPTKDNTLIINNLFTLILSILEYALKLIGQQTNSKNLEIWYNLLKSIFKHAFFNQKFLSCDNNQFDLNIAHLLKFSLDNSKCFNIPLNQQVNKVLEAYQQKVSNTIQTNIIKDNNQHEFNILVYVISILDSFTINNLCKYIIELPIDTIQNNIAIQYVASELFYNLKEDSSLKILLNNLNKIILLWHQLNNNNMDDILLKLLKLILPHVETHDKINLDKLNGIQKNMDKINVVNQFESVMIKLLEKNKLDKIKLNILIYLITGNRKLRSIFTSYALNKQFKLEDIDNEFNLVKAYMGCLSYIKEDKLVWFVHADAADRLAISKLSEMVIEYALDSFNIIDINMFKLYLDKCIPFIKEEKVVKYLLKLDKLDKFIIPYVLNGFIKYHDIDENAIVEIINNIKLDNSEECLSGYTQFLVTFNKKYTKIQNKDMFIKLINVIIITLDNKNDKYYLLSEALDCFDIEIEDSLKDKIQNIVEQLIHILNSIEIENNEIQFNGIIRLIYSIYKIYPNSILIDDNIQVLTKYYNANYTITDRKILNILFEYEKQHCGSIRSIGMLYGEKNSFSKWEIKQWILNGEIVERSLNKINHNIMLQTIFKLPKGKIMSNTTDIIEDKSIYDSLFIINLIANWLCFGSHLNLPKFIKKNGLGFLIACLAHEDKELRFIAYRLIDEFYALLITSKFNERVQVVTLLDKLKNSIIERESIPKLPTSTTLFVALSLQVLMQPKNAIYLTINKYLLGSINFSLLDMPMFQVIFNKYDKVSFSERSWLLNIIAMGLKNLNDFNNFKRSNVIPQLLDYYHNPAPMTHLKVDKHQLLILSFIFNGSQIPRVASNLIANYHVVSFLKSIVKSDNSFKKQGLIALRLAFVLFKKAHFLHVMDACPLWNLSLVEVAYHALDKLNQPNDFESASICLTTLHTALHVIKFVLNWENSLDALVKVRTSKQLINNVLEKASELITLVDPFLLDKLHFNTILSIDIEYITFEQLCFVPGNTKLGLQNLAEIYHSSIISAMALLAHVSKQNTNWKLFAARALAIKIPCVWEVVTHV